MQAPDIPKQEAKASVVWTGSRLVHSVGVLRGCGAAAAAAATAAAAAAGAQRQLHGHLLNKAVTVSFWLWVGS